MSAGFLVRGHRGRWLHLAVETRLRPRRRRVVGHVWEGDPFYATVFPTCAEAEDWAIELCPMADVVPDPLARPLETLGRRRPPLP